MLGSGLRRTDGDLVSSLFIDFVVDNNTKPFHLKCPNGPIVFNTLLQGAWLDEISFVQNPLKANESFTINILIDASEGFNVSGAMPAVTSESRCEQPFRSR